MEEGITGRQKADDMGVEHLATLERLRQNQRQDYLKVSSSQMVHFILQENSQNSVCYLSAMTMVVQLLNLFSGFSIWFGSGYRSINERVTRHLPI